MATLDLYLTLETQPPLFYLDSHPLYSGSEETKDLQLKGNGGITAPYLALGKLQAGEFSAEAGA